MTATEAAFARRMEAEIEEATQWLVPEIRSVPDVVRHWAEVTPNRLALQQGDERVTYAQLDDDSSRIAQALLAAGAGNGAHIGYLGKNHHRFFALWFGICKAGSGIAPFNWRSATAELVNLIEDAQTPIIFAAEEFVETLQKVQALSRHSFQVVAFSADGSVGSFLEARGLTGPDVAARAIGDGHSNLTFLVTDGQREVVVRRPPPPPVPRGANDVLREARLVGALFATSVPVPQVLAIAQAGELLDVPFYVMSYVKGPVVTDATPSPLAVPAVRREIGESMVDTLVALHSVDWESLGLSDIGRPVGFNARHLDRMGTLVADADRRAPAGFGGVDSWLHAHVPAESGASILHNDYRIGNVILAADPPGRVLAVLDWELATLGDPLFDLGYFLAGYPVAGEPLTPTGRFATAVLEPGYATRNELAQRYATATGSDLDNMSWYITLALWKLAVLYEYGRRRADEGVGDQYYRDPALVQSFLDAAADAAGI